MRPRSLAIGVLLAGASFAVALAVARGGASAGGARPTPRLTPAAATPVPPPVVLSGLRDVFRFSDDREGGFGPVPPLVAAAPLAPVPATPEPGPRLVGLVRRSDRLIAALALEGEVVLAGPGESAGDITVVSVGEEAVRIRRGDGSESTLVLP